MKNAKKFNDFKSGILILKIPALLPEYWWAIVVV